MKANSYYFDMSEYDANNPLFSKFKSDENKKVLGKFKDEYNNKIITHIAAPRPKMYALRSLKMMPDGKMEQSEAKRAKGINRTTVNKHIHLSDYVNVMENANQTFATMRKIASKRHCLYTEILHKKALNSFCNKRFCVDSINSLAYGNINCIEYDKDITLYNNNSGLTNLN